MLIRTNVQLPMARLQATMPQERDGATMSYGGPRKPEVFTGGTIKCEIVDDCLPKLLRVITEGFIVARPSWMWSDCEINWY